MLNPAYHPGFTGFDSPHLHRLKGMMIMHLTNRIGSLQWGQDDRSGISIGLSPAKGPEMGLLLYFGILLSFPHHGQYHFRFALGASPIVHRLLHFRQRKWCRRSTARKADGFRRFFFCIASILIFFMGRFDIWNYCSAHPVLFANSSAVATPSKREPSGKIHVG